MGPFLTYTYTHTHEMGKAKRNEPVAWKWVCVGGAVLGTIPWTVLGETWGFCELDLVFKKPAKTQRRLVLIMQQLVEAEGCGRAVSKKAAGGPIFNQISWITAAFTSTPGKNERKQPPLMLGRDSRHQNYPDVQQIVCINPLPFQ